MQMLFILIVVTLMMLGLVSLWEIAVKSLKPQPEAKEPINYDGIGQVIDVGLTGIDVPVEHSGSFLGRMMEAIAHAIGHLFHH